MEHPDRNELQAYLSERDAACPGCGYNLRGLTTDTCPECNQQLELRVALTEPRLGAFLTAVTGLLAGGGIAAVFLAIVVIISLYQGRWPRSREAFAIIILPLIAVATLLGLAAVMLTPSKRRWFRSLDRANRLWVIAGCWGLTAAFVAWFLGLVFRM